MQLVIGLGNPGKKYSKHRHNVGFMAAEEIASALGATKFTEKFGGLLAKTDDVMIFLPQGFMNNSGIATAQIASFYKIPLQEIIIIYDDLDLAFGKIKIKQGGGDGGHNGIRSLDAHLGKNYWRLRFGIGHPGDKNLVHDYVLGNFSKEELKILPKYFEAICTNAPLLLKNQRELFLTRYFERILDN